MSISLGSYGCFCVFYAEVRCWFLSAPFHKYDDVCGERDGVEGAKRRRGDAWYRRGGATKPSARPVATRRADGGCGRSLRWSSSKMAKHRLPPPALISPHKPHLHTSSYLWKGALTRISHRQSTAAPQSSALAALRSVGLLDVLHEYDSGGLGRKPCQDGVSLCKLFGVMFEYGPTGGTH